jgi:hypothetical protein
MYTTTKYAKEAMFPHTGTWTLNEFVLVGGDATSDNLPPRFSQIQYAWRSPSLGIQQQIYAVLEKNARHVAAMTGCRASVRWVTKTRVGLTNHAMTDLTFANMGLAGAPLFPERARDFARQIQSNLGLEPMENPFLDDNERLMPPAEYEARLRRALPEWQTHYTSDDYVDYTWHAPTVRLLTMRPRLRPPSPDYEYPAWAHNALGGLPAAINPGILLGAKTIAATLLDLLTEPALLKQAQDEFRECTGGGVGGTKWIAPLLPKDFAPPVPALARINPDPPRRGMVDPDPGGWLRRRRAALIGFLGRSRYQLGIQGDGGVQELGYETARFCLGGKFLELCLVRTGDLGNEGQMNGGDGEAVTNLVQRDPALVSMCSVFSWASPRMSDSAIVKQPAGAAPRGSAQRNRGRSSPPRRRRSNSRTRVPRAKRRTPPR